MAYPAVFESTSWPDGLIQLLDDHHVAILCDEGRARHHAERAIHEQLSRLPESRVIDIDCAAARDLPSFCKQLEPHFADRKPRPEQWWRDVNSVIDLLRGSDTGTAQGSAFPLAGSEIGVKREYFLWHEAECLLETDLALFSALVNAFLGVAAEREHISAERLLIQRVVFFGGAKLGAYADDPKGQFSCWLKDDEGSPLWEVISVVERPMVITYRVDG